MNGIRRGLSAAVVLLAICVLLSACGLAGDGYDNTVAGDELSSASGDGRLRVFTLFDEPGYTELVEQFKKNNPGITVEDVSLPYTELAAQSLSSMLDGEAPPDVVFFYTAEAYNPCASQGLFVPVEEIRRQYPDYAKDILPAALDGAAVTDTRYAVPVRGFYEGLYVNTGLFEQHKADVPKSWDELLRAVDTFRAAGVVPIAASLAQTPHYLLDHLLLADGGADDFLTVPASAQEIPQSWPRAFERLHELYGHGAFGERADTITDAEATEQFVRGKAAMRVDGSWLTGQLLEQEQGEGFAVVSFPGTPQGALVGGYTSGFYITRSAWENDTARNASVSFVNALTSRSAVQSLCDAQHLPASALEQEAGSALERSARALYTDLNAALLPADARMPGPAWAQIIPGVLPVASGQADARGLLADAFSVPQQ